MGDGRAFCRGDKRPREKEGTGEEPSRLGFGGAHLGHPESGEGQAFLNIKKLSGTNKGGCHACETWDNVRYYARIGPVIIPSLTDRGRKGGTGINL